MIVKTKSSLVIRPYDDDVDKDAATSTDNNEHSTSRLDVGDCESDGETKLNEKHEIETSTCGEPEKSDQVKEGDGWMVKVKMDLSQATNLSEILPNLDDVLGLNKSPNKINSQHDEAQIQKISNNLEATGASILQQAHVLNGQNVRPYLPNTSFSHQLPPTIPQHPSSALLNPLPRPPLDLQPQNSPGNDSGLGSNPPTPAGAGVNQPSSGSAGATPGVWDIFNKQIENFADGDHDDSPKKTGLKVLTPMKLKEQAPEATAPNLMTNPTTLTPTTTPSGPRTIRLINPGQQIRGINPTVTRIMVQRPGVPVSGGRPVTAGEYLNPRLPPGAAPVIRLSVPSSSVVTSLGQSLVMSHPPVQQPQPSPQLSVATALQTSPTAPVMSAAAPPSPAVASPTIRGGRPPAPRGGPRMRGGMVRPGMRPRLMRPGAPGAPGGPRPRGMRPRGPMPPGVRLRGMRPGMRPGGPGGSPRPGGPRPVRPGQPGTSPVRAAAPAPSIPDPRPAGPGYAPPPKPKPLKVECIDLSDDDDSPPAPPAVRSATLEKLKGCGISISKQKAPSLPSGVRLPPGISLASSGSSSAPKRSSTSSYSNGEPRTKRVPVDSNVASALSNISGASNDPKEKVMLELSEQQINALKALGML